ncbi:MAG TPA: hypothetical protein VF133_10415 [Terriglobales bacterium]
MDESVEDHRYGFNSNFFARIALFSGAGIYLYFNLFIWPRTPILLSGDQLFFWMNGQRILHGELPYRDFFQFTPPGADLVYFAAFKAFAPRIWILNLLVLLLGVALCGVCFEIARRVMRVSSALLAALLFLTLIYSLLLNATHHWFSMLAVMIAIMVMRGTTNRRLAFAGALLGMASFFTQTHAVVALLATLVLLRYRRTQPDQTFGKAAALRGLRFCAHMVGAECLFHRASRDRAHPLLPDLLRVQSHGPSAGNAIAGHARVAVICRSHAGNAPLPVHAIRFRIRSIAIHLCGVPASMPAQFTHPAHLLGRYSHRADWLGAFGRARLQSELAATLCRFHARDRAMRVLGPVLEDAPCLQCGFGGRGGIPRDATRILSTAAPLRCRRASRRTLCHGTR